MKFQKNDYQNEGRFERCDSVDAICIKKRHKDTDLSNKF